MRKTPVIVTLCITLTGILTAAPDKLMVRDTPDAAAGA